MPSTAGCRSGSPIAAGPSPSPDRATALDYLEKIFQVPFWLPAMEARVSRALLARIVDGMAPEPAALPAGTPDEGPEAPARSAPLITTDGGDARPAASPGDAATAVDTRGATPALPPSPSTPQQAVVSATIEPEERAFMLELAPHVGRSPRRLKRFVNTYRILKAACDPLERRRFVVEGGRRGEYREAMTLLAMMTGAPRLAVALGRDLLARDGGETVEQFAADLDARLDVGPDPELALVHGTLAAYRARAGDQATVATMKRWVPMVSRFTFRSGTLAF